ncbi:MAG: hypothetical protein ACSHXW_18080 [Yoonia sp.]
MGEKKNQPSSQFPLRPTKNWPISSLKSEDGYLAVTEVGSCQDYSKTGPVQNLCARSQQVTEPIALYPGLA